MNTNINNNIEFNSYEIIASNHRSGHALSLNGPIKNLNDSNLSLKITNSNTHEINKIINSKGVSSNLTIESALTGTTIKNNLNMSRLLIPSDNHSQALSLSENVKVYNDEAKYFSIGNKHMNLNVFKTLLKNFNLKKDQIEKFTEDSGKLNLRHYLNLITAFQYKLSNSTFNLYQFNKTNKYLFAMKKATNLLNISFNSKGCYISKPSFSLVYTNNKIENEINKNLNSSINTPKFIINLFYYIKTTELGSNCLTLNNNAKVLTDLFERKVSYLTDYLTKLFNAEVELNLVRLYKPHQESGILVQSINSDSYNNKFIRTITRLFKEINLNNGKKSEFNSEAQPSLTTNNNSCSYPSNISGVNIKLAGRSLNERVIPRLTVKRAQRGSFNRLNAKLIEKSMFTDKTRKGAFSFTVTLSQNFK